MARTSPHLPRPSAFAQARTVLTALVREVQGRGVRAVCVTYPQVVDEIKSGAAWQPIDAVRSGRIWLMPEYAKAWGYPMPEAMALGELWMAKTLYPDRFADIDMEARADSYYRRFYRVPNKP